MQAAIQRVADLRPVFCTSRAQGGMIDRQRLLRETFLARAELYAELGSTNDRAIQAAAEGGPLPLLVLAERQTAGRGRGSNRWWTGSGSLAFSLLLPPWTELLGGSIGAGEPGPRACGTSLPAELPRHVATGLVGLAAGLAVVEAVRDRLPDVELGIHWPNDVFAAGRKLAGILVEVLPGGRVVAGIGLNCNNSAADAPEEIRHLVATLRDLTGREHARCDVLIGVLQQFERLLSRLSADPAAVARAANASCLQRGRQLRVRIGPRQIEGRCLGIAPDGALRLQTPQGAEQRIYSGVVVS